MDYSLIIVLAQLAIVTIAFLLIFRALRGSSSTACGGRSADLNQIQQARDIMHNDPLVPPVNTVPNFLCDTCKKQVDEVIDGECFNCFMAREARAEKCNEEAYYDQIRED